MWVQPDKVTTEEYLNRDQTDFGIRNQLYNKMYLLKTLISRIHNRTPG